MTFRCDPTKTRLSSQSLSPSTQGPFWCVRNPFFSR